MSSSDRQTQFKKAQGTRWTPCVLTKFLDNNPQRQERSVADNETEELGYACLRREILENIEMILNSRSHPLRSQLGNDSVISSSVLGFGLDDFCGKTNAELNVSAFMLSIAEQIKNFEPRLDPNSVQVTLLNHNENLNNRPHEINISIFARIAVQPYQENIICVSKLDLDVGRSFVNFER